MSAERSYREALEIIEKHRGSMNGALLDPLRGLGYSLAASGRHADAIPVDRALIVGRRNFGLFDIAQQGVLRQLAVSLSKLGRSAEAERHMIYLLRVGERTYGQDDPRLAPVLRQVADWYSDIGAFLPARELFRRAVDIVDRKLGRSHLAAVEPLRGLARTYTQEMFYSSLGLRTNRERVPTEADGTGNEQKPINPRYLNPEGEKALERALKIVESQPTPPPDVLLATLIQLGDWRQIKHQPDGALPLYRRAAGLVAQVASTQKDGSLVQKDDQPALLSFPVRLYYPVPWLATKNLTTPGDLVEETFVEVEFTVTSDGEVTNARITDQNGTVRQSAETLEAIRAARFRPRFENGEPVETSRVTNREVFKTRKSTDENQKS